MGRRFARAVLAFAIAVIESGETLIAANDYPCWRGGPNRSGAVGNATVLRALADGARLAEVWRSEALPAGFGEQSGCVVGQGSPVVYEGKVYLYVNWPVTESLRPGRARNPDRVRDTVICLDLTNGATFWKTEMPGRSWRWGCSATLAVAAGRAVAVGSAGEAFCLDADTGEELWRHRDGGDPGKEKFTNVIAPWHGSALIHGGLAVAISGGSSSRMFVYDLSGGALRWSADIGAQTWSSPCAWGHGERWTLMASGNGYDPITGNAIWKGLSHGWGTPAVEGERCAVMGGKGLLIYQLTQTGPKRLAEIPLDNGAGNPAIADGRVYACGARNAPVVDPSPMPPVGVETLKAAEDAPPEPKTPASEKRPTAVGVVVCVDAETGAPIWETADASLSIGGGQWSFTSVNVGSGVVCILNGSQFWLFAAQTGKRLAGPIAVDNLKGGTNLAVTGDFLITRGWKAVVCYKATKTPLEAKP